jgi:hypothetical protein
MFKKENTVSANKAADFIRVPNYGDIKIDEAKGK